MTLINKTLAGIPDQDTYYDFVDPLEELNLNSIASKCAKLDTQLKEQFELYEQVLKTEDDNQDDNSTNQVNSNDDNSKVNNTNKLSVVNNNKYQTRRKSKRNWSATPATTTINSSATATAAASSSKMNDRYEMSSSTDSFQIRQQQQQQLQKPSQLNEAGDESKSGANTVVNDDNYESANESNDGSDKQTSSPASSDDALPKATTTSSSSTTTTSTSKLKLQPSKQQHLLHNPAKQQPQHQNGLARGKQQRASISSCSSSDSYASYGSGYASGSGNSTDLEHKQRVSAATGDQSEDSRSNATGILVKSNNNFTNHAHRVRDGEEEDDEGDDEVEEEEEEEDDSQLKQHLSELEQLTDELASRNIFGTLSQPTQSTSKLSSFSSTIKSTSSNSSSILSTGSNLSSLSATQANSDIQQQQSLDKFLVPSSTKLATNSDSRSTSATPTSTVQPNTTATSSSLYSSPSYVTNHNATGTTNKSNEQIAAYPSSISKPSNHHYAASITNSAQQQPSSTTVNSSAVSRQEPYYHNLFQWEQLVSKGVTRPLLINDLDFTDLRDEDDCDLLNSNNTNSSSTSRARNQAGELLTISIPGAQQQILNDQDSIDSGTGTGSPKIPTTPVSAPPPMPPPPISPWFNTISGSRPQSQFMSSPSPPYNSSGEFNRDQSPANQSYPNYSRNSVCLPQAITPLRESSQNQHFNTLQPVTSLRSASSMSSLLFGNKYANKRKKTMKLFWKEVREDRSLLSKLTRKRTIWDEIKPVQVDTQKLEHLFESKAKDLLLSKSRNGLDGLNQRKVKITVLDAKRSNAINIGMTKLPPMRTIKTAILKMDSSIMNREGIEKILTTMMPSEEEKSRIIEAQLANPDTPLGTAEQFLLNLASISALEARLKLWAFQLDYAQIEKEVAEPLMDLKQAIEEIERSETFRIILGTLLAIGNFLNSTNVKGFQIDYLEKVPEVKDTVHKHSLLHHLCLFIQEKYDPQLTNDLYSEFGAVNRASKVDYTEVAKNLKKMQQDCKASWDYLKIVAKHDGLANMMNSCGSMSTTTTTPSQSTSNDNSSPVNQQPKPSGKLNNLSKLSMITTVISSDSSSSSSNNESQQQQQAPTTKQLKTKVSDFLTDCAERIMVLIVIHRRVMNRFQKLLVYLGCPSHQIKQTQPQQVLKIINEFALEYRTKRERVREMLLKKQQCQHHHHHANRWQLNRTRWAGSQQCIDSLSYNHHSNRPCSTTSSCAESMATISLAGDARHQSIEPNNHLVNQHHMAGGNHRTSSPSGFSQISNYSDYLFDHSCCNSRQQSITPVPLEKGSNHYNRVRPNSMSVSMFDLQSQQQHHNANISALNSSCNGTNNGSREGVGRKCMNSEDEIHGYSSSSSSSHQKDEQLRRLLGARKSLDETCNELYQMSHWSSTMARVVRRPPPRLVTKNRTVSMDSSIVKDDEATAFNTAANVANTDESRQSSYYKHLHDNGQCRDESEQNSDEEILQSLVRNVTAKSSSGSNNNNNHDSNNLNGSHSNRSTANPHSAVTKGARNKILSRFNCDRKSCK